MAWRILAALVFAILTGVGGYVAGSRLEARNTSRVRLDLETQITALQGAAERQSALANAATQQALTNLEEARRGNESMRTALAVLSRDVAASVLDVTANPPAFATSDPAAAAYAADVQRSTMACRAIQQYIDALAFAYDSEVQRGNALRSAVSAAMTEAAF